MKSRLYMLIMHKMLVMIEMFALLTLTILSANKANASPGSFCSQSPKSNYLELAVSQSARQSVRQSFSQSSGNDLFGNSFNNSFDDSFNNPFESFKPVNYQIEFGFDQINAATSDGFNRIMGIDYQHQRLDYAGALDSMPLTNGYLHRFALPIHWLKVSKNRQFRFSLAPAIATSSNRFKDPLQLTQNDLQLWLVLENKVSYSSRLEWLYGLCADHRFGGYRGYPVVGMIWQLSDSATLRLAYPDSAIHYRLQPDLNWQFGVGPSGHQWRVYNDDFTQGSSLSQRAWRVQTQLGWQLNHSVSLTVTFGQLINPRWQYLTQDFEVISRETDNVRFWQMSFRVALE